MPTRSSQWTTPGGQGQQGQHSQHSQDRQDRIKMGRTVPSQVGSTGPKSMHFIDKNCFCSCLLKYVARPVHRRAPKNSVSRRRNSTLRKSSDNVLACSLILSRSGFDASEGFKKNDDLAAEGRQFTAEITKPFWNQHRLFPFIGALVFGSITQLGISCRRNG